MSGSSGSKGWLPRLGIIWLILSLGRVPLPFPDLHGFDHVDLLDATCPNHDHLARHHRLDAPGKGPTLH